MAKPSFIPEHKVVLDALLSEFPEVRSGKMFGYPAYYVNGRLFACLYDTGVGMKVPEKLARELLQKGKAVPFQPLGKARMREWIQIDHERSGDYRKNSGVFRESVAFVGSRTKAKRPGATRPKRAG